MKLEDALYRTNRTILDACEELGIPFTENTGAVEPCSHCSIWYKEWELIPDLDGNPICKFCSSYYGM